MGGPSLLLPLSNVFERRGFDNITTFIGPRWSVHVLPDPVNGVAMELPEGDFDMYSSAAGEELRRALGDEVARLNGLSKFDLLVAIFTASAESLEKGEPFAARLACVYLLGLKAALLDAKEETPFRYYEGPRVRCLVTGPQEHVVNQGDLPKLPEGMTYDDILMPSPGRRVYFYASATFKGTDAVVSFRFRAGPDEGQAIELGEVLSLLSGARVE